MARPKVLLIGWDGADWEVARPLLERGLLPTLSGLIDVGVWGNIASLTPMLSPMLWNSVATGKHATKHGIHGFIEPDPDFGGVRMFSSLSRETRAVWNILHHRGYRCNVVNWWASHPAEPLRGCVASNAIGEISVDDDDRISVPPGGFHPAEKAAEYGGFRVFSHEILADQVLPFIPRAAEIDQRSDRRLNDFRGLMSECLSTHAITTAIMEREPWDFMATYYTAIDHFSHRFMDYHPPRRDHISETDFEIYSQVMEGIYRFHDMMLERSLQLAGPDTTVILCSDHGFQSAGGRLAGTPREPAGPAAWHRPYGMLVMAGPEIKQGCRVHGATLLDVAPTILHLFGLPVGRDMDGRVLMDAMQSPQEPNSIASWDQMAGDFADPEPLGQRERPQGSALLEQFAALGYVDDPALDDQKQAKLAGIEARYNLARCHASIGQYAEAESLLQNLLLAQPWDDRFILHLADCNLKAGKLRESERLLDQAYELSTTNMAALLIWAQLKLALREEHRAREILDRAVQLNPHSPVVMVRLAELYLVTRDNELAISQLECALEIDPEMVEAHVAISAALLRTGRFQEAVDSALCAIDLVYQIPRAHINLGVGLARGGDRLKAIEAFENVQRFAPGMPAVLRWLSHLHGDSPEGRSYHDQLAKAIDQKRSTPLVVDSGPEFLHQKIDIPGERERLIRAQQERPDSRPEQADSGRMLVIVSGLPRSGTSLMMQILDAGGLPAMTDQVRGADADNPKGYLEWEAIKSLPKNPTLLDDPQFTELAIKITSPLISQLPRHHRYKIVFMERDIAEVATSQSKMIQRQATVAATLSIEDLRRGLDRHLDEVGCWLADAPNIEVLRISYRRLLDSPAREIAKVIDFLGPERLPNVENMAMIVDRRLYRNRSSDLARD